MLEQYKREYQYKLIDEIDNALLQNIPLNALCNILKFLDPECLSALSQVNKKLNGYTENFVIGRTANYFQKVAETIISENGKIEINFPDLEENITYDYKLINSIKKNNYPEEKALEIQEEIIINKSDENPHKASIASLKIAVPVLIVLLGFGTYFLFIKNPGRLTERDITTLGGISILGMLSGIIMLGKHYFDQCKGDFENLVEQTKKTQRDHKRENYYSFFTTITNEDNNAALLDSAQKYLETCNTSKYAV